MNSSVPEKKSLKPRIGLFLMIAFIAIWALYNRRQDIQRFFVGLGVSSKLRPYEQQVKKCLAEEEAKLNKDEKVLGLEYSCAIKVAAGFYAQDEGLAIELCMKHRPFAMDDRIQRTACQSSIKIQVERSTLANASSTNTGTAVATQKPKGTKYENTKYGYNFYYSTGVQLSNLDDSVSDVKLSKSVYVFDAKNRFLFAVDALDPAPLRSYPSFQKTVERYGWPLPQFAEFIEKQNAFGKNLVVTTTEMKNGQTVYEFWFDGSFNSGHSSETLEPARQAFFYAKPKDVILQIRFPAGSDASEDIFASLEF